MSHRLNRREFLGAAAASTALTIVPRHVLGGPGYVPPSDKINLAYIGTGTQGLREMIEMLPIPEIQIVSVCDPSKDAVGYWDWSRDGLLKSIRKTIGKADWNAGGENVIPGGRDAAKSIVETYYASQRPSGTFQGCSSYADFRELLAKEKDVDAVKIMTPDHLHGVISIAAMKKGKHVIMHKPVSNRLEEARLVIETARAKGVATHFIPYESNGSMTQVMAWIKHGSIGKLLEVHNWTNRPVWPQYNAIPTDTPPVPSGFDWDLWLGPEAFRPYHPHYTHMVFRGWYDFGGGSMADMGHYSLWTVFNALELTSPTVVEPRVSHTCEFIRDLPEQVKNDFAFPTASVVRFKYPAHGQRPAVDLFWYDGGMRPPTPPELDTDDQELPAEGMMFVGSKGIVIAGFLVDTPRLLTLKQTRPHPGAPPPAPKWHQSKEIPLSFRQWMAAAKGGPQSPSSFLNAAPISEAVNLWAVALRTGRKLRYDAESRKITNVPDANKYLSRQYRSGWDPESL